MHIQVARHEKDWVDSVWNWVHKETQPGQRVFLPAGNTPLPVYRHWTDRLSDHLTTLRFVQIDDILTGPLRDNFKNFFMAELKPYLKQFEWIEAADGGADVAILGVGLNGHVAFHEPTLPQDFYSGCVSLTSETCNYLKIPQPTWGVTYGAASFLKCNKILILARGEQKRQIMQLARSRKDVPIGWIMNHTDVTLISDFEF